MLGDWIVDIQGMVVKYTPKIRVNPKERETAPPKNGHPPFYWLSPTKRGGAVFRSPGVNKNNLPPPVGGCLYDLNFGGLFFLEDSVYTQQA